MKKIIIAVAAGSFLALAAANSVTGQGDTFVAAMLMPGTNVISFNIDSNTINVAVIIENDVKRKAKKKFDETFKGISSESWDLNSEGISAGFTVDSKKTTVFYDNNGCWKGTLVSYPEGKLRADIRSYIKQEFKNYAIKYVNEVTTAFSGGVPTYLIHIEDPSSVKLIKFKETDMDVWGNLK